jgi:carbamoyltransferase
MNTSLNIGGEPLVCTPEQVIKTFYLSAIDCLALGNYWITKDEK